MRLHVLNDLLKLIGFMHLSIKYNRLNLACAMNVYKRILLEENQVGILADADVSELVCRQRPKNVALAGEWRADALLSNTT